MCRKSWKCSCGTPTASVASCQTSLTKFDSRRTPPRGPTNTNPLSPGWLKRSTTQNIVIGGAAGAFPPLIGWAAATGRIELMPALLFALIFLWTPPHFWALSLFIKSDYSKAGVPMLPVVAGLRHTRQQILLYTFPMVAVAVAPWQLGLTGALYGMSAILLSIPFVALAAQVSLSHETDPALMKPERRLFAYSILYLFGLFGMLVVDRLCWA